MKKLIKNILYIGILFSMLCSTASAKIGDIIGYTKYSDIAVYINHYPITSYNINGKTAVVAEDLANYGFNVLWNEYTRSLNITRNTFATEITPFGKVYRYTAKAGQDAFPYLESDIVVYVNGNIVESFNINGKICIYINSLTPYGEVAWVPEVRAVKMWIDGLPINTYAPLEEEHDYSAAYKKLKAGIIAKGDEVSDGYEIYHTLDNTEYRIVWLNELNSPKQSVGFMELFEANGKRILTRLVVFEDNSAPMVGLSYTDADGEWKNYGIYESPQVNIFYSEFTEEGDNTSIEIFNDAYTIFDSLLQINGIDVRISDFGIDY